MHHGELDGARLHDFGAERGHLQHLLVGDLLQALGFRHDARIGGVDAVDVRVDVAQVGLHRDRQGDRARVGAAASERRDAIACWLDALEAGDDGDLALFQALDDLLARDVLDARHAVGVIGDDRDLPALPRPRLQPHGLQDDGEEPRRHLLAGRDDGIVLARIVQERRFAHVGDELVRDARHRGHDHGHLVAGVDLAFHVLGHVADALDIGNGRAAEFHHYDGHCKPRSAAPSDAVR